MRSLPLPTSPERQRRADSVTPATHSSPNEPFVDHEARAQAALLFEQLRNGLITEVEFQTRFPRSIDPALGAAYATVMSTPLHALPGHRFGHGVGIPPLDALDRWSLFLRSSLPFGWPPKPPQATSTGASVVGALAIAGFAMIACIGATGRILPADAGLVPCGASVLFGGVLGAGFLLLCARARRSAVQEWDRWVRAGDARVYPFRAEEDLIRCGIEPLPLAEQWVCPRCGYDLTGLPQPGCPECGLGRIPR